MTKSKLQFINNFIFWFFLNLFLGENYLQFFTTKNILNVFTNFFSIVCHFFIIRRSIRSRNGFHMTWFTNRYKGGCSGNVTSMWQDFNKQGNKFLRHLQKSIPHPSNLCPNYCNYHCKLPNIITVTWLALFNTLYNQIIILYLRNGQKLGWTTVCCTDWHN